MKSTFKNTLKTTNNRMEKYKEQISLFLLCVPAIIFTFIWSYIPMSGLVLAFKDYNFAKGMYGSDWSDPIWKNFNILFQSDELFRIVRNTVGYALLNIVLSAVCGVILALLLFEVTSKKAIKTIQTLVILPRFLSWVVVGFISYALLHIDRGVINQIIVSFGGEPVDWYTTLGPWVFILPFFAEWKKIGVDSIMYYAALMSIDSELFEAAELDGANKFQKIWHISLPSVSGIMIILTILAFGSIFRGDFGLFYQIPRNVGILYPVTDVIDTYVIRGMTSGSYTIPAAVGLIQSFVGLICIVGTNLVVKKIDPEKSLF